MTKPFKNSPLKMGDLIEGTVASCAFGGEGVVRYLGQVVFVPFSAPGDTMKAKVTAIKKNYARAELENIAIKSPHRQSPACSLFGSCGGCQLQHIDYEQQLIIKQRFVEDAFLRIGRIKIEVLPVKEAQTRWSYRRHIRLHLKKTPKTWSLGYVSHDNKNVIDVDRCHIFDDGVIIDEVRTICQQISAAHDSKTALVSVFKDHASNFVVMFEGEDLVQPLEIFNALMSQKPRLRGVIIKTPGKMNQLGDCSFKFSLHGLTFTYEPAAFVQAHPEQSERLYLDLVERIAALSKKHILDLYCGIGITSMLLAKKAMNVVGIEKNPRAIKLAEANAHNNGLKNLRFIVGDVDSLANMKLQAFDIALVNPPRTGLSHAVLDALLESPCSTIFYISCMPATLARDVSLLAKGGFRVTHCQPYDMFPQTTHVETLVELTRQTP